MYCKQSSHLLPLPIGLSTNYQAYPHAMTVYAEAALQSATEVRESCFAIHRNSTTPLVTRCQCVLNDLQRCSVDPFSAPRDS